MTLDPILLPQQKITTNHIILFNQKTNPHHKQQQLQQNNSQQTSEDEHQTSEDEQQTIPDTQISEDEQQIPNTQISKSNEVTYIPETQQTLEETPVPNIHNTPNITNDEQPFITITKRRKKQNIPLETLKTIPDESNSILWWTSPPNRYDSVKPKYEYNPNDLYWLIAQEKQEQYYKQKERNNPGAPLLKGSQRRTQNFCCRTADLGSSKS